MQTEELHALLDDQTKADGWLKPLGIVDARTARSNLTRLATTGLPLDLLATICEQFAEVAPRLADPDMALNNLERFLQSARSPLSMAALFERDPNSLPNLLQMLNCSQYLSDQLCTDPESYELLRTTRGRPVSRELLVEELVTEVQAVHDEESVMRVLRRFKRRETLRIAYGDFVAQLPVAQVTRQISYLADALIDAALQFAIRSLEEKRLQRNGQKFSPPKIVVLALGKLGGLELNYSSDVDLVVFYQLKDAASNHDAMEAQDFVSRVVQVLIRLLTESTELGFVYRVDMRLRPEGKQGRLARSVEDALAYYENRGRTWERQTYVKARPVAGDLALGRSFLQKLEPWVYSRYLTLADISGIKSLKRKIEDLATEEGISLSNVKTGHGGIRDIEFVIQFLQLLNGGVSPEIRTGNTLDAIERLEQVGSLTRQERSLLEENYSFLRRLEHRLQIMYDLQTHQLPTTERELGLVALRMGFAGTPHKSALAAFQEDYLQRSEVNRRILDHLLHDAFGDDPASEPEVDLINDPDPTDETIQRVLGRYPFADTQAAYTNLMSLAEEPIPFLSSRRCRLFLASIAPRLLSAISETPDPDGTLMTLSRVSDSLGGKAALWELFSNSLPSLNLYVTLCASCPYLAEILTSNPGMIDELLDTLLIDHLPSLEVLEASLAELTHGAEDPEPILHSFKYAQHLRVGVRDILGKDKVEATHATLSDIAEACLKHIIVAEFEKLVLKLGRPVIGELPNAEDDPLGAKWHPGEDRVGQSCEFLVMALGKLGGREPNYHSDLDLVFLYEAEGKTVPDPRGRGESTTNNHFFSELGQRIIKRANQFGPYGRLFEIDPRLRPTGRSGALTVSLGGFVRYFQEGGGQLWERQALCKARMLTGSDSAKQQALQAVAAAAYGKPWQPSDASEIRQMRFKLEESASVRNLKRGPGGTMDTEFVVQMLQLKHGPERPDLRVPNTIVGITTLADAGILSDEDASFLRGAYRFQRHVEACIRLMNATGRHEFPDDPLELSKVAFLLGYESVDILTEEVMETFCEVRGVFTRIFDTAERN